MKGLPRGVSIPVTRSPSKGRGGQVTGTFTTTGAPPAHGDNLLSLTNGDTITALYIDADDGLGGFDAEGVEGAGGGFDVFIAGQKVGVTGRAIGVDMTPEMVAKARKKVATDRPRAGFPPSRRHQ